MFAGEGAGEIGSAVAGTDVEDPSGVSGSPRQAARTMAIARKIQRENLVIRVLLYF